MLAASSKKMAISTPTKEEINGFFTRKFMSCSQMTLFVLIVVNLNVMMYAN